MARQARFQRHALRLAGRICFSPTIGPPTGTRRTGKRFPERHDATAIPPGACHEQRLAARARPGQTSDMALNPRHRRVPLPARPAVPSADAPCCDRTIPQRSSALQRHCWARFQRSSQQWHTESAVPLAKIGSTNCDNRVTTYAARRGRFTAACAGGEERLRRLPAGEPAARPRRRCAPRAALVRMHMCTFLFGPPPLGKPETKNQGPETCCFATCALFYL